MAQIFKTSLDEVATDGAFKRTPSQFRDFISSKNDAIFKPEKDRYHLYVSFACPWACRTLTFRNLKGLQDVISVSCVRPVWETVDFQSQTRGWVFAPEKDDENGSTVDHLFGCKSLKELYLRVEPNYSGKFSVPVLFDRKTNRIVNNESSEIIRMLNSEFNEFAKDKELNLYPIEFKEEIDRLNDYMYDPVNNGVYRCGFAKTQEAYAQAFHELFEALDYFEELLKKRRFLCGKKLTEADIRFFVTIIRFDVVYVTHFKTNKKRIVDYPNIFGWLKEIYQTPQITETVNFYHIKNHYFRSHPAINPFGIVPLGPELDLSGNPHREQIGLN